MLFIDKQGIVRYKHIMDQPGHLLDSEEILGRWQGSSKACRAWGAHSALLRVCGVACLVRSTCRRGHGRQSTAAHRGTLYTSLPTLIKGDVDRASFLPEDFVS